MSDACVAGGNLKVMNLKLSGMVRYVWKKLNPKKLQFLCLVCLLMLALITMLLTYLILELIFVDRYNAEISKRSYWVDDITDYSEDVGQVFDIKTIELIPEIDTELLERCVEAEAGNQGRLGKAYVCDVILNRLDSGRWGDTLEEVILYPNAFSVVSNGTIYSIEVTDETKDVIEEELLCRQDYDIISFRTGNYFAGLVPAFQYKDHYFSK